MKWYLHVYKHYQSVIIIIYLTIFSIKEILLSSLKKEFGDQERALIKQGIDLELV